MSGPAQDAGETVLHVDPPRFSATEAVEIAHRVFGMSGGATPLGSERDQNFKLGDSRAESGVLKISNHAEEVGILDMETEAILHVARADPELPIARPRPVAGAEPSQGAPAYRASISSPDGVQTHFVRLFEYVPGSVADGTAAMTSDAIWEYGVVLARLGRALRGFFHPAAGRFLLWDVQNTTALRPFVSLIPDADRRRLIDRVIDRFEIEVAPLWPALRQQVIHGDFTLDNTLLDERMRVSGIVDFGDMSHTALACDLSAALASVLRDRDSNDLAPVSGAFVDGYESVTPLEDEERRLLATLVAARLAATVVISAWRVPQFPDNEYIQGWAEGSWPLLEFLEASKSEEATRVITGGPIDDAGTHQSLEARRKAVLGPALSPLTYERPVHVVRGHGVWLFDSECRRYLDAYNNVPVVGHCHSRVTGAIARQARTLNTNVRYLHETAIELAERLLATVPAAMRLDTVMLVNSGSEANDLAFRLAKTFTGRKGAIVTANAYHGISAASADLSPDSWPAEERPNHVETIPAPDVYRAPDRSDREWGAFAAAELTAAGERLAGRNFEPAAVYMDGGLTSDGILTPPSSYFQELVRGAHAEGALFVADEVQVGHGRTGDDLWFFAAAGIAPDLVTLGKPMGNGHPVAAVITRSEIVERFASRSSLFSTFGGNQVAAAAALAVLDVIRDERLTERAAKIGGLLRAQLAPFVERYTQVGDVRGRGLLIGIELVSNPESRLPDAKLADRVMNELRDRGILIGLTGSHGNVLKIRPPLVFGLEHAEMLTNALDDVLANLET